ncbi:putative acyl dehydratase MaoC [Mycobacterium xenopi 3993]|nr:putative acyl dehydratase MaoC [Mycobacterium xenopi 3993]
MRERRGTISPATSTPATPKVKGIQPSSSTPCTSRLRRPHRDQLGRAHSRVVRRNMTLAGSIYAGDTMVGRGHAVAKRCDTSVDPPRYLVDLRIEVTNQRGELCCPVELTLQL